MCVHEIEQIPGSVYGYKEARIKNCYNLKWLNGGVAR